MEDRERNGRLSPEIYVYATNKNFLNLYDALRIDKVKLEIAGYDPATRRARKPRSASSTSAGSTSRGRIQRSACTPRAGRSSSDSIAHSTKWSSTSSPCG